MLRKRGVMIINRNIFFLLLLGAGVWLGSCQQFGDDKKENRPLAKVFNKTLYISEMEGLFPEGTTSADSAVIINAFVQRWIREAVLLHHAERSIPKDLNIDKLVRDYRASLIRHNYEKFLVGELLDSAVSKNELVEFYEANKDQYQLETPIIRCFFIKVPLPVPEAELLRRLWNSNSAEDFPRLAAYCNQYAEAHLLADSAWYKVEDIARNLPKGTLTVDNVSAKRDFSQRDETYQYYFKVFELKNRKEIAPLSYIEDQARKVILHKRKLELLEETKDDMYEQALRRNQIEIFSQ